MKKMKLFAATAMMAMVATAGYFGYTAYKQANMTDAERMMQANLEALTDSEIYIPYICIGEKVFCDTSDGLDLEGVKYNF